MPKKYSNLTTIPNVSITNKEVIKSSNMIFQCIKATFSGYEATDKFGRVYLQVVLSEMKSSATLSLYKLNTTNLNDIDFSNIDYYLGEKLAVLGVSQSKADLLKDIDILKIVRDARSGTSFSTYFAVKCDSVGTLNFNLQSSSEEVLVGELYNPIKESYLHESTKQDLSFVGTGLIDLFNVTLSFSLLNILTSGKTPAVMSATYNESRSGIFGEHISADFEYKGIRTTDYIEIINSIGDSTYYQKMSRSEAIGKYGIEPYTYWGDLHVNLTDHTYLLYASNQVIIVNKDNSRIELTNNNFANGTLVDLYVIRIVTDKFTTTYARNTNNRITSIKTNDSDKITITYNSYSNVSRIDYDKMRYVKFTYSTISTKRLLTSIQYCNNNNPTEIEVIQATSYYEYGQTSPHKLSIAYDNTTKIGCKYEYTNDKVSKITSILKDSSDFSDFTSISKVNSITKLTNNLEESIYYYFDAYGRCYLKSNDDGNVSSTKYQNSAIGANPYAIGESKVEKNINDILLNGNFEGGPTSQDFSWIANSTSTSSVVNTLGYNGKMSLRVYNIRTTEFTLTQNIINASDYAGKTLYLKGYVRGNGNVSVNLKINNTDNIVSCSPENLWNEIKIEDVILPTSITSLKVIIKVQNGSDVRLSNFSLCVDNKYVRDNYIQNGKFINSNKNWSFTNTSTNDGVKDVSLSVPLNKVFKKHFEITGDLTKIKEFKQAVNLSGGAGEELLFSYFAKANVTINDLCYSYMEIEYMLLGTKTYTFNLNTKVTEYQKVSQSIISESAYKKVTIGIRYLGVNNAYFSDFGLYKEQFGSYYSFNDKNSLTEIANGSASTSVEQGSSSRIKRIQDATGEVFEYTYNGLGDITLITDSNGNSFEFEYDSNNFLMKNTITTINGKKMSLEQINDSSGNVLTSKDYNGNITAFEYDDKERLKTVNNSNGLVSHFKYDDKDNVIKKSYDMQSTLINHNFSYNNDNTISEIDVENGSKYNFNQYDGWGNLENLTLDNKILSKFTYYRNYNFYTGLLSSEEYSNGSHYYFYYDDLLRLKKVEYAKSTDIEKIVIVEYKYDKTGNMINKIDICGEMNYFYDSNGLLIKEHVFDNQTEKSFLMEYDNLGNLQQKSILLDNETNLNYDYVYKYEYNEYKSGGYFSRLENSFNEDIIFEEAYLKYGAEPILNTVEISRDIDINRNVLKFTKNTSSLSFLNSSVNSRRIEKTTGGNLFNQEEWQESFSKRKEIIMWVRVNNFTTTQSTVKILSMGSETNEIASLSIGNTGQVILTYNGQTRNNMNVKAKEWNLIGLTLEEIENSATTIKLSCFVNQYIYANDATGNKIKDITRIMLGEYHDSNVTNNQLSGGTNLPMSFDIMYVGLGEYQHNSESYKGIYNEGYKYIFTHNSNPTSGIIYYNHNAYSDMDVIPLNGNLTSVKGLKPLEYTYGDSSFIVDKTKLFKLDRKISTNDSDFTSRHTYGSYKEDIGINGKNKSMLAYDLGLKTEGTISLRFKCDFMGGWNNAASRTIITCPSAGYGAHYFLAYIDNTTQQIKVSFGGITYYTGLNIFPDKWHLFTVTWNSSTVIINIDDQYKQYQTDSTNCINLTDCKTYIGCNYLNNEPCLQLAGSIEMLTYTNAYKPNVHYNLKQNGKPISILTEYDEAERPYKKEINTGFARLNHLYKYNDEESQIGQHPTMEVLPDGTIICYSYDRSGNIVHKIINVNGSIKENIHYKYDVSGRLLSEKCYNSNMFEYYFEYKYSNSGDILEKIEYNNNGNIKTKDIYSYSSAVKNQLLNVKTYDSNNVLVNTKYMSYSSDDPFRPNSYNLNDLTWQGRRLVRFGNNSYEYNSDGVRISKTTGNAKTTYVLDGNKIVKEKKHNYNPVYYHYDENKLITGFNYNGDEYFYIRDITGNITKIIDVNGNTKAEYTYNSWGRVLSVTGNTTIVNVNSFIYKGYYYDTETSLYYCNSRYYDPSVGRWISADDSSYLDPKTINGINLWAYCGNNPVMGYDPEGTWNWKKFWKGVLTTVVIVAVVVVVAVSLGVAAGTIATVAVAAGLGGLAGAIVKAAFQDDHYNRNENQEKFMEGKTVDYFIENWVEIDDNKNIYHRHTIGSQGEDAIYNKKYMDSNNEMEVIICFSPKNGNYIVTDPFNYGTYNYGTTPIPHFFKDVVPYWLWGNSPEDSDIKYIFRRIFGA